MAVNFVEKIDGDVKVNHVLASVSDKTGLDTLVPALVAANPNVTIYSTGGTYKAVKEILGGSADTHLVQVSDYTGQPEMQGGLVKTLDFKIYLGLLSETYNDAHAKDLERTSGVPYLLPPGSNWRRRHSLTPRHTMPPYRTTCRTGPSTKLRAATRYSSRRETGNVYEVSITTHFSAAHRLVGYEGCCRNVHGHNWEVTVKVRGRELDELGMLVDFRHVKAAVGEVLEELDHADLNELPAFSGPNPTSENIAKYVYEKIAAGFDGDRCAIHHVTVSETPRTGVTYWTEDAT
jgi:queuosine biosynthesis protein QueD